MATNSGDLEGVTAEMAEHIIRSSSLNPYDDIWISGNEEYPCLAILINGNLTCVHYFLNDNGDMWQSVGSHDKAVMFLAGGEKTEMPADTIIPLEEAILCMREFFHSYQRPTCIEWREL